MKTISHYFVQMAFPSLVGVVLWLVYYPWRKRRRVRMGYAVGTAREKALLLLFVFSAGLFSLTLTPPNFWPAVLSGQVPPLPAPFQGEINLVPFRQSLVLLRYYIRHGLWDAIWVNFPGNVVMFLPFGFFAGLLSDKPTWWKSTLVTFGVSFFIECFQLLVARGTDVDDLILNAMGGLLGHGCFLMLRRFDPGLVRRCGIIRKGCF